ncbi:MAG: LamG domain-containing protein, partial [Planctomycetes bacterium]|nr:LamG domain-containing protein [Planctomycetota bacterium]
VGAVPSLGAFSPETTIVYGGSQSLPIHFDNSGAPRSEATRPFGAAMDWTKHGVQGLVLFFRGSPANTGGQLYVKINGSKVVYDGAPSDLMHLGWNKWTIPLSSSVSASTLSRVTSLTIGIEGNGSGVLYVDEMRLTTDARVVVTPTGPSDEALVAHYAFDGDASDSTGQSPGALFGDTTSFVPGVDGQALRLDGINAYVAIDGLFYDSSGLTEVTVTAWIRTEVASNQIIASFDRNEYWRLEINGDGGGPGQVGWDVWTDTGQLDYGSSSRVDDNEWHHVAGVFDHGTSTIFIDGYHEAPAMGGSTFGTGNTRFGYVGVGSESTTFNADPRTPASFFIGDLDDVRIYHRALSAAEVAGMAGRTQGFDRP